MMFVDADSNAEHAGSFAFAPDKRSGLDFDATRCLIGSYPFSAGGA
jgi:hypothetical protein